MTKETIIENKFITLWFHSNSGIVHHRINPGRSKSDPQYRTAYRNALMKGAEVMKERGTGKWLSDDRHYEEQSMEDVEWGQKNWLPKVAVAGWRFWALVMPESALSKMSLNHIISKFAKFGVTVKVFLDPDDAQSWLESV